ncbi:MAG: DUF3592 domain-containing protein, partial [Anaerolineae bacterium]|nr:DUF3592 domain-containing protein [Anaerolineae bacterium]
MVAQDNIWRDIRRASRIIGALLTIVGGLVIAFQGFATDMLPPADGFVRADAIITRIEQRGTFRDPTFAITLAYTVTDTDGRSEDLRSGKRVEFDVYDALSEGETVTIGYNPSDPYEWRLLADFHSNNKLNDYALGLLMVLFGGFSLIFPTIVRLASRED